MNIALISHPDCLLHAIPQHPEQPARIQVVREALLNSELKTFITEYEAPLATQEQLVRVHDNDYVQSIFQMSPTSGIVDLDLDTAMNPFTLNAALRAAGSVVQAVDLLMSDQANVAFCNVRPPGHHAEHARAMGFCFFNNVAVGAAHAIDHYKLKRVVIIDFDVHHGNGTQDIFQSNTKVLFCSTFQHPFYPFSGAETNTDHIINIPLPAGTTGREFRAEIEQNWLDRINAFRPELIFFSAGFDGHVEDGIANVSLTEFDYAWLTRRIKQIADIHCNGRMISALEGGYALNVLGRCVKSHIEAMII